MFIDVKYEHSSVSVYCGRYTFPYGLGLGVLLYSYSEEANTSLPNSDHLVHKLQLQDYPPPFTGYNNLILKLYTQEKKRARSVTK